MTNYPFHEKVDIIFMDTLMAMVERLQGSIKNLFQTNHRETKP